MYVIRFGLAMALMLSLVCATQAKDKEKGDVKGKLVGTWEVTKSRGDSALPVGSRVTFSKDGKTTISFKQDGEKKTLQGTFKVDGNTLKVTHKQGDEDKTHTVKLVKVSDKEVYVEGEDGHSLTFKKVAAKGKGKKKEDKSDK